MSTQALPPSGEVEVVGRIVSASNSTFLARIGDTQVVYKPIAGERPLWDFPDGDLASRELAAFEVSEHLGWGVVPQTWRGEGPFGEGMLQLWCGIDPEQSPVDLVPATESTMPGWRVVFDGYDSRDRPVTLVHEDTAPLRRMAVFDVIVNNADRKGGHVLAMLDGHRYGVDHGLTFHQEHKLRTVLWGWLGEELSAEETEGVRRVREGLAGPLGARLAELLTSEELVAFAGRCDRLLDRGTFPAPRGEMPAVPWPVF